MKFSVIVPVYNARDYVSNCIESVLRQSCGDFELILIDDGSVDDSVEILKKYEKMDERVRVIVQDNMGVSLTRNKGIKLARGEYVVFLDNDDYVDDDYLERFADYLKGMDVVIGGYRRVGVGGEELYHLQLKDTEWAKYTFITPWARVFRREFLLKNKISFLKTTIGEDVYFNLNVYSKTKKIRIISYIGYNWLNNMDSVSNTVHKGFKEGVDIVWFLNQIYPFRESLNGKYMDYYCYKFGIWYLLYSGRGASRERFLEEYSKIHQWNIEKGIGMKIFPFSKKLAGERFTVRGSILMFFIMEKLHLMGLFSYFYCK